MGITLVITTLRFSRSRLVRHAAPIAAALCSTRCAYRGRALFASLPLSLLLCLPRLCLAAPIAVAPCSPRCAYRGHASLAAPITKLLAVPLAVPTAAAHRCACRGRTLFISLRPSRRNLCSSRCTFRGRTLLFERNVGDVASHYAGVAASHHCCQDVAFLERKVGVAAS